MTKSNISNIPDYNDLSDTEKEVMKQRFSRLFYLEEKYSNRYSDEKLKERLNFLQSIKPILIVIAGRKIYIELIIKTKTFKHYSSFSRSTCTDTYNSHAINVKLKIIEGAKKTNRTRLRNILEKVNILL